MCFRLQYSIYAGRHVVPGLKGLLLECTADVNRVWSPLGVWLDEQTFCTRNQTE